MTRNELLNQLLSHFQTEKNRLVQPPSHESWAETDESGTADELDYTTAVRDRQLLLRLKSREAAYARKIEQALLRIREGTFGYCESCEEEIEMKRLEARPTASKCVACKESEEREEQVYGDGLAHKRPRLVSVA